MVIVFQFWKCWKKIGISHECTQTVRNSALLRETSKSSFIQSVQLKGGPYFNMSNLFTKIYNMLYYTTNLYLQ